MSHCSVSSRPLCLAEFFHSTVTLRPSPDTWMMSPASRCASAGPSLSTGPGIPDSPGPGAAPKVPSLFPGSFAAMRYSPYPGGAACPSRSRHAMDLASCSSPTPLSAPATSGRHTRHTSSASGSASLFESARSLSFSTIVPASLAYHRHGWHYARQYHCAHRHSRSRKYGSSRIFRNSKVNTPVLRRQNADSALCPVKSPMVA